ncbi:hypothetical protein FGRMN_6425 [Fusarium graminum]|nr:hypothetical protein FGRMN_6425 [Fusarium graminum]
MKFTVLATALLATLLPPAQADFDIFMIERKGSGNPGEKRWQIWDRARPNTCTSVFDRYSFRDSQDVSGRKMGVRCKGACGYLGPTRDIEQLEMNFRPIDPVFHFTIYKDRNYGMYGRNDYECKRTIPPANFPTFEQIHGYRKFHCKSEITAANIMGA